MQFGKRIGPLARRVAAMQIPVYAGNASFFLLLSVFPVVSLLLSLLPYTPLTLDHLLAFCEEFAPDWTLRALEFFVRTLYASSSAAIISASAVLTLWSASKGMLSLLYGLDAVAEVRETRGYVQRRLLCVLYTVGMLLALLLTLGLYVGGQALLRFLTGRGFSLAAVLEPVLRHLHLVSLVLLTALFTGIDAEFFARFLATLYRNLPWALLWQIFAAGPATRGVFRAIFRRQLVENDRKAFSSDTECDKMDA